MNSESVYLELRSLISAKAILLTKNLTHKGLVPAHYVPTMVEYVNKTTNNIYQYLGSNNSFRYNDLKVWTIILSFYELSLLNHVNAATLMEYTAKFSLITDEVFNSEVNKLENMYKTMTGREVNENLALANLLIEKSIVYIQEK